MALTRRGAHAWRGAPVPDADKPTASGTRSTSPARGMGSAVLWSVLMGAGRRVTTTLVTFVLAGLLGPDAFGAVALATIFVFLAQLLFQQGLAPALIRQPVLTSRSADIVLRLALLGSVVMVAAVWLAAPATGVLFNHPDVAGVLRVLALSLPLQAVYMVQEALLRRASDFRSLALRTNTSVLLGGLAGVGAAVAGAGISALILQQYVTTVVGIVALWSAPGAWRPAWRPRRWWRDEEVAELLRFSTRTSGASAAQFLQTQLDSLLAGAFFGVTAVGLYRLAARLVESVLDLGARSVQLAVLPDLARQSSPQALRQRLVVNQRTLCSVALPPLGVLAGAGTALVAVLGPEWRDAGPPVALLALAAVGTAATSIVTPALQALGRAGLLVSVSWVSAGVSLGLLCLAAVGAVDLPVVQQVAALAGARVISAAVLLLAQLFLLARACGLPIVRLLAPALPGILSALSAWAAGSLVSHSMPTAVHVLGHAAAAVGAGVVVGFPVLMICDRQLTAQLLRRLVRPAAGARRATTTAHDEKVRP